MFILSVLEDDIRVEPKDLGKTPLAAVTDVIETRFIDKVRLRRQWGVCVGNVAGGQRTRTAASTVCMWDGSI